MKFLRAPILESICEPLHASVSSQVIFLTMYEKVVIEIYGGYFQRKQLTFSSSSVLVWFSLFVFEKQSSSPPMQFALLFVHVEKRSNCDVRGKTLRSSRSQMIFKMVFLKIWQYCQENTCVGASFCCSPFIKRHFYQKQDSTNTGIFL